MDVPVINDKPYPGGGYPINPIDDTVETENNCYSAKKVGTELTAINSTLGNKVDFFKSYIGGNTSVTLELVNGGVYMIYVMSGNVVSVALAYTSANTVITELHPNSSITYTNDGTNVVVSNSRGAGGRISVLRIY